MRPVASAVTPPLASNSICFLVSDFFHLNDVHAHLDQYARSGSDCRDATQGCYGGYARIKSKVDDLRRLYPNSLLLNAGDEFQGTLFYTFYGGTKIAETINELAFDAMTLGNHEWDRGDDSLASFLSSLSFPIVSCNVKSSHPGLNKTIKNYQLFPKHQLAVIGATTDTTPDISNVGNATIILDPIAEVQKAVYEIRNTTSIRRILALTHIGFLADQDLAARTEGLSLIVGGHSHTLLGDAPGSQGKYPTIVKDLTGRNIPIVTAYQWGKYLGSLHADFGNKGEVLSIQGSPILMDNSTDMDKELQSKIISWRRPFEKFASEVIGTTINRLDKGPCQRKDCLFGQVAADAMLEFYLNQTRGKKQPDFAIINAGSIRITIEAGNITRGQILTAIPFGNVVVELEYRGSDVRKILEGCVSRISQFTGKKTTSWFQVSRGLVAQYNARNKPGSTLVAVEIGGVPLDDSRLYRIATVDYMAKGGDNLLPKSVDFVGLQPLDQVVVEYIQGRAVLGNQLEKRVVNVNERPRESLRFRPRRNIWGANQEKNIQ